VAAGQQPLRALALALAPVAAHHIAHGVDLGAVETAGQHPALQVRGAGAVRRRGVGDGQVLGRVAVARQLLGPVPDLLALGEGLAQRVGQAQLGNAVDLAQALLELAVRVRVQAALEGFDDLRAASDPSPADRALRG
jgi:hypothetical protein